MGVAVSLKGSGIMLVFNSGQIEKKEKERKSGEMLSLSNRQVADASTYFIYIIKGNFLAV